MKKNKGLATVSLTECAKSLGISSPRLIALVKEGRVPRNSDGSFDPVAVRAAFEATRDPAQASKISPVEKGTFVDARIEHEQIKVRRARRELDLEEGRLMETDKVVRIGGGMIVAAKNRLLGIGDKLAPRLAATSDPVTAKELVNEEIRLALSELSKWNLNSQQPNAN